MPTRLDHVVILVRDLEEAARDYERLGFRVTPGGEHADGLTRNALVPFREGTYLELVAFVDHEDGRDNVWGWRGLLPREGLVDYCAASDGLREEIGWLRGAGLEVEDLGEGGRRLPGGAEIRWRSASIAQEGRVLPFLIEDVTPRRTRVPGVTAAGHPNGATGISRLEISGQGQRRSGRPDGHAARDPQARGLRPRPRGTGRGTEGRSDGRMALDGRGGERRGAGSGARPRGPVHVHTRSRRLNADGR